MFAQTSTIESQVRGGGGKRDMHTFEYMRLLLPMLLVSVGVEIVCINGRTFNWRLISPFYPASDTMMQLPNVSYLNCFVAIPQ